MLTAVGCRVFLDTESLLAGDQWPQKIKQAQEASLLTAVLISDRSDSAYYQKDEILEAIDRSREDETRRVVPIYLSGRRERGLPAPLRQLQGIYWEEGTSLLGVAQSIEAALTVSKKHEVHEMGWCHHSDCHGMSSPTGAI